MTTEKEQELRAIARTLQSPLPEVAVTAILRGMWNEAAAEGQAVLARSIRGAIAFDANGNWRHDLLEEVVRAVVSQHGYFIPPSGTGPQPQYTPAQSPAPSETGICECGEPAVRLGPGTSWQHVDPERDAHGVVLQAPEPASD